ncbi:MAG TPA: VOC family protein [Mucilaginibacter sp.]|nr:VOC family protein [Mucilaginibacter sp.]
MIKLNRLHHLAIICSDYQRSKQFYTEVLGLKMLREVYRSERDSWKLDLEVNGQYQIELFSFPNPPVRPSRPEAAGLRHLAFEVSNIEDAISEVKKHDVETEPVRVDEHTGKRFTFFADPDGLPIELYEI